MYTCLTLKTYFVIGCGSYKWEIRGYDQPSHECASPGRIQYFFLFAAFSFPLHVPYEVALVEKVLLEVGSMSKKISFTFVFRLQIFRKYDAVRRSLLSLNQNLQLASPTVYF